MADWDSFHANRIEIVFPLRDLQIKSAVGNLPRYPPASLEKFPSNCRIISKFLDESCNMMRWKWFAAIGAVIVVILIATIYVYLNT